VASLGVVLRQIGCELRSFERGGSWWGQISRLFEGYLEDGFQENQAKFKIPLGIQG